MSFFAHLLKTPNRGAGAFGVFLASPEKKYACLVYYFKSTYGNMLYCDM